MLAIIRSGKSTDEEDPFSSYRPLARRCLENQQTKLVRAPGILTEEPSSILKPIARAATMPPEFKQPGAVELGPFAGPSLFANFKRSMTTDERIQHWQQERVSALAAEDQSRRTRLATSLCGDSTKDVRHIYTTREADGAPQPRSSSSRRPTTDCSKCTILSEALIRLRKNLTMSEQNSAKPSERSRLESLMEQAQLQQRTNLPETREPDWVTHYTPSRDVPKPSSPVTSTLNQKREPLAGDQPTSDHLFSLEQPRSASEFKKQLKKLQREPRTEEPPRLPPAPRVVPTHSTFKTMPTSIEEWRKHQQAQLEMIRNSRCIVRSSLDQAPQLDGNAPEAGPSDEMRGRQILDDLRVQRQQQAKLGIKSTRCTWGSEQ
jgi:hypothetical protein